MLKKVIYAICYGLLFVLILVLADFYKQPIFIFLLMLLVALLPTSYFTCKQVLATLVPFLRPASQFGISGNTILLSIGLHNPTFFPIPNATFTYRITSSYYPCEEVFACNVPLYSQGEFSFDIPIIFDKCGCYQIQLTGLQFYDYLHLFTFTKPLSLAKEITIYPKQVTDLSLTQTQLKEGFDEFEEIDTRGIAGANVTGIREYIPGDRLQQIHWKLSVRLDKLMVKQPEHAASNQFMILVELYLPTPDSRALEESLSLSYSAARYLLNAGETFFFAYFSTLEDDFIQHLIHCKEDLDLALLNCFYQSPYQEENYALDIQKRTQILKGTILHISEKGVNDIVF